MPVGEFFLTLQHGITGGFAPPTPDAVHTITQSSGSDSLMIASALRLHGTPSLQDAAPKNISSKDKHTTDLVEELHGILKSLPTESPPGSADIYGMDTMIAWGSDDLEWRNAAPEGCSGGQSSVQPTPDEKAKFKRAVDIVTELTKKDA